MANQFTKGSRTEHDPATRDKMRAEKAASKLQSILDDKGATKEQVIAAAKALLPYGKSTYASIMETHREEVPEAAQLMAQIAHLLSANPAILKPLMSDPGFRASLQSMLQGSPSSVALPQEHKVA